MSPAVSAAWVAGSVRARSMSTRRLGRAQARSLAAAPSLEDAVGQLVRTPYGHDVRPGASLAGAQRAVHDTLVWNARVLGGWVPRRGAPLLRVLLGSFEIANVAVHLRRLHGSPQVDGTPGEPVAAYRLGSLGTAWPRLAATGDPGQLRRVLATSAWGDPGGDSAGEVLWSMRMSLADRTTAVAPGAATWAAGAVALMLARAVAVERQPLPPAARVAAARVVGGAAVAAGSLPALAAALPRTAAWALRDVGGPEELWRAEGRWWARVERDGLALARAADPGPGVVLGALALLACDAWRVRAALEVAARPGISVEALDAVA